MTCKCKIRDRKEYEPQREWLKDCMCMLHWMQSDYYQDKLDENPNPHIPRGREDTGSKDSV